MRAARVHRWGSLPVFEQVPDPVRDRGETLVQVTAAAVGHFDLTVARGEHRPGPSLPYVPGTDGAGRVLASGTYGRGPTSGSAAEDWASAATGPGRSGRSYPTTRSTRSRKGSIRQWPPDSPFPPPPPLPPSTASDT